MHIMSLLSNIFILSEVQETLNCSENNQNTSQATAHISMKLCSPRTERTVSENSDSDPILLALLIEPVYKKSFLQSKTNSHST